MARIFPDISAYNLQTLSTFVGVRGSVVSEHPGSTGGDKGVYRGYDNLGRVISLTNPTAMNESWEPTIDNERDFHQTG